MNKHRGGGGIFTILFLLAIGAVFFVCYPNKTKEGETTISVGADTVASPSLTASASKTNYQSDDGNIKAAVLMYHYVGDLPENADNIRRSLTVSGDEFEQQVKYFIDNNYAILSLEKFDALRQEKKIPEKTVIMTFDDGYLDNYEVAFPVLKKYNASGTFFIITKNIGAAGYMNEDQIKEISAAGDEIGSHSVSHLSLDKYKGNFLKSEVSDSKAALEKILSKTVISFCYPSGKYNADTVAAVKDAGYKYAVTTKSSAGIIDLSNNLEISRYRMSPGRNLEAMLK